MSKLYTVSLGGNVIGTTLLEKHDAPMGVAFGVLHFGSEVSGYDLFRSHCIEQGIALNFDVPAERMLDTRSIPDLIVRSPQGVHIDGLGTTVSGSDQDEWEVCVFGIGYPFYAEEFPDHTKDYYGE